MLWTDLEVGDTVEITNEFINYMKSSFYTWTYMDKIIDEKLEIISIYRSCSHMEITVRNIKKEIASFNITNENGTVENIFSRFQSPQVFDVVRLREE